MSAPISGRAQPFTIASLIPEHWPARRSLGGGLDLLFGLRPLAKAYDRLPDCGAIEFADRALDSLDVTLDARGGAIPPSGGLMVVANHPTGALDGLALLALVRRARPDIRVLGNVLLSQIPNLRDVLLAVDPFREGGDRVRANVAALRAAGRWLESGGCLLTFPSGEVAYRVSKEGIAIDNDWHGHVATLILRSRAATLPVFLGGSNGRLFRSIGVIHPLLRTALLPRELWRRRHSVVRIVVGEAIPADLIERIPEADRAAHLKARTYLLAEDRKTPKAEAGTTAPSPERIAEAIGRSHVAGDVAGLPPGRLLVESARMRVYCAPASELPHVLPEIGRLREVTFRAAGEGTGKSIDLDRFDAHYWHLFAWDAERESIVGAYRIGPTDDIIAQQGPSGLYTSTLFRYDSRLLDEIGAALELGRSFVRAEYQREFAPLLLLWKGIGRFIALRPHYRSVFGAVSISNRYESLSRQLLVTFLTGAALHPRAARLVRPRRPLLRRSPRESLADVVTAHSLEAVSDLIGAIEADGKPIPVLLRQYLNLNARLLGFSVDPEFGEALDGLMLADLTNVPSAMLQRLMGKEGAAAFLAHHGATGATAATAATGEVGALSAAMRRVLESLNGTSTS